MNLPSWFLRKASFTDREVAELAYKKGTFEVIFHDQKSLNRWMDYQGWKRSWFFPEKSFYQALFENDKNFELALENVIDLYIPKSIHQIADKELDGFDQDYQEKSFSSLVAGLRDIRRAIEAGVIIQIGGKTLNSFGAFYTWAHNRYHLLEEGSDKWIGDDK